MPKRCGDCGRDDGTHNQHCHKARYEDVEEAALADDIEGLARSYARDQSEVVVEDSETGGRKAKKLARFDLLPPDVLWALAEHYGVGANKYEDRNWEKGYAWSLSFQALQRHLWAFWGGEDLDAETGSSHLAAALFHVCALLRFTKTHPSKDDRGK